MKFIISSHSLKKALDKLSAVDTGNTVIPVLLCTKVDVNTGSITLTVSDLQTTIKYTVECETKGTGSFLIPFRELRSIVSIIDELALIEWNEKTGTTVKFDKDKFNLGNHGKPDEFPIIPEMKTDALISVGSKFFNAISVASKSIANDLISNYIKSHLCIEFEKNAIYVTGTDANTLFTQTIECDDLPVTGREELLLTGRSVMALQGLQTAEVCFNKTNLLVRSENIEIYIRLGEGKYPDYRSITPPHLENLTLDINDLLYSVDKSFILNSPTTFAVDLVFSKSEMLVKTVDSFTEANCDSTIPCNSKVGFEEITFNRKKLQLALKQLATLSGQDLSVSLSAPHKNASFKVKGSDDVTVLIFPIAKN